MMARLRALFLGILALALSVSAQTSTELTPNVITSVTLATGEDSYFKIPFQYDAGDPKSLTITTTPVGAGDPDLYADFTEFPDLQAPYVARSYGEDSITIPAADLAENTGNDFVFITVHAYRGVTLNLVAHYDGVIQLEDGQPQSSYVAREAMEQFIFQLPQNPDHGALTVITTPTTGRVHTYISNSQAPDRSDPLTYQWSTAHFGSRNSIIIPADDINWPTADSFYIGVYGEQDSNFQITVATNNTNIVLRDGVPQTDSTPRQEHKYYQFPLINPEGDCRLSFTVTPITGDPDLYISQVEQNPTSENYVPGRDRRATRFGGDTIVYEPAPEGNYYIGVVAFTNTTYTITASSQCGLVETWVNLIDGQPQSGNAQRDYPEYFRIIIDPDVTDLDISLTRLSGQPALYVSSSQFHPGPGQDNSDWSSTLFGDDLITIHSTDPKWCPNGSPCPFYIAVVPVTTNCSFSLTATTSQGIITLQNGVPLTQTLAAGQYEYFQLPVDQYSVREVTISVAPLGISDPDLYASTSEFGGTATPSAATYPDGGTFWKASSWGGDALSLYEGVENFCVGCTYFVGVYGFSNTTFTITASFDSPKRLIDGVPAVGSVVKEGMALFDLTIPAGRLNRQLSFTLTTTSGLADLFVSNTQYPVYGNSDSYQFYQYWWFAQNALLVPEDQACPLEICRLYVGVYGALNSEFTLTVSSEEGIVTLYNGIAHSAHVGTGEWQYFAYDLNQEEYDLSFIVTPLTGDPDLYVTRGSKPNATSYDCASRGFGGDECFFGTATPGKYYAGVKGFRNTTFTILAIATRFQNGTNELITLTPGSPQSGTLQESRFRYYSLDTRSGETPLDLTFTLNKLYGDPDMYITNDGSFPTRTNYQWASTSSLSDIIDITNPTPAQYIIGVYAYHTTSFTLTALVQNGIVTLQDGLPFITNQTASTYRYYRYFLNSVERNLEFIVSPLSGDPDLFMSRSNVFPNQTENDLESRTWGGDAILVSTDSEFMSLGWFHISVYSFLRGTEYSITAVSEVQRTLFDGVPQSGFVNEGEYKFYRFRVRDLSEDITFSISALSGNPKIYISVEQENPTRADFVWSAGGYLNGGTVTIDTEDPDFCDTTDCVYYMSVYGLNNANYTLTVTSSHETVRLQNGSPVQDQVDAGEFEYFYFTVPEDGLDLFIAATAITGDPDLYMSMTNPNPTRTNYTWAKTSYGADAISLEAVDAGNYYIGVYGFLNTQFTITAFATSEEDERAVIRLVDGVPQDHIVPAGKYGQFRLIVVGEHEQLSISVERIIGDPDVYVLLGDGKPDRNNYNWSAASYGNDIITIQDPEPGQYRIAVYGFNACEYTITAQTSSSIKVLRDGVSLSQSLQAERYDYFQLPVDSLEKDVTVTVTATEGDPDLYASDEFARPNRTNARWKAIGFGEDSITIPKDQLEIGTYYIAVYAFRRNCSFTITASFAATVRLQNGVPQSGFVAKEAMKYYTFPLLAAHSTLQLFASPSSGSIRLFLSNTEEPDFTNSSTYQWTSYTSGTSSQSIEVTEDDANWCTFCTYYVGVRGGIFGDASFTITASTNETTTALRDGVSSQGFVQAGGYAYFSFRMSAPPATTALAVTVSSSGGGDADLYMSKAPNTRPTRTDYTWRSSRYGDDAIGLDSTDADFSDGIYYIGVYAYTDALFSVLASVVDISDANNTDTTRDIILQPGEPQLGFLSNTLNERYYSLTMPPIDPDVTTAEQLVISVTERYGFTQIFARSDGIRAGPGVDDHEYYGSDNIVINNPEVGRRYTITVYAYDHTLYDIVGYVRGAITQLSIGIPQFDTVSPTRQSYYQVRVWSDSNPLTITTTSFSDGAQPRIFISSTASEEFGNVLYPNLTHSDYAPAAGSVFQLASPPRGMYYIGVQGTRNTSYAITASNGPRTLRINSPELGAASAGETVRYRFYMAGFGNTDDLVFNLAVESGEADMYVSHTTETPESPGENDYVWNTLPETCDDPNEPCNPDSLRGQIRILEEDANACFGCEYYVSVVARRRTAYAISAAVGDRATYLISGRSVLATLEAGATLYFQGFIDDDSFDINIDLVAFLGNVRIFASNDEDDKFPSETSQWTTDSSAGANGLHLPISKNDPEFKTGRYHIAVYAETNAKFSILLSTQDVMLMNSVPQVRIVPEKEDGEDTGTFYFFNVDLQGFRSDVQISVEPNTLVIIDDPVPRLGDSSEPATEPTEAQAGGSFVSQAWARLSTEGNNLMELIRQGINPTIMAPESGKFDVYVANNGTTDPGPSKPYQGGYMWYKRVDQLSELVIGSNDAGACDFCTYYIGVYGVAGEEYIIKASTEEGFAIMIPDQKQRANVTQGKFRYYEVFATDSSDFSVTLETCTGNADLYMSHQNFRPDLDNFEWSEVNDDQIDTVVIKNPYAGTSSYYIGVYGDQNSEYEITSRLRSPSNAGPVPGNDGLLSVSSLVDGVELSWTGVDGPESLKYTVYYSAFEDTVMYSECGLTRASEAAIKFSVDSGLITETIDNLRPELRYQFNVVVEDEEGNRSLYRRLARVATINPDAVEDGGVALKYVFGIGIPVGIVIALVVFYLVRKNRKLTKELNIEMYDVPNGALRKAAKDPAERNQKNWSKLLEDEEPASDAFEYNAPEL